MKKNYLEPEMNVSKIMLGQMIAASWEDEPVIPINPGEAGGDGDAKEFEDFFD